MGHDSQVQPKTQAQYEYQRHQNAVQMRKQVINFAIMIFLTFVAFATVLAGFSPYFIKPVILLLAGIQVVLQLYSFMHMDDKSGFQIGAVSTYVWSGVMIILPVFIAFVTIVWW